MISAHGRFGVSIRYQDESIYRRFAEVKFIRIDEHTQVKLFKRFTL